MTFPAAVTDAAASRYGADPERIRRYTSPMMGRSTQKTGSNDMDREMEKGTMQKGGANEMDRSMQKGSSKETDQSTRKGEPDQTRP